MKPTITRHNDTNNLLFANVIASFPHLIETTTNTADPKKPFEEYSCDLLFPKDGTDMTAFDNLIEELCHEKWKAQTRPIFRYPYLKDGDKKVNRKGEQYAGYPGHWYVTVKAKESDKPTVVDRAKNDLDRRDAIVGGDLLAVLAGVAAYDTAGNRGISFWVNTAMLLQKSDTPLGGGMTKSASLDAMDQFSEIDDMAI